MLGGVMPQPSPITRGLMKKVENNKQTTRRTAQASSADYVTEQIRAGIKSGRFLPGQRLIESALAEDFSVSRGPVREALGRLAAEELLLIEHNRGAIVRRLSRGEVTDLFRVREVVEGLAARQAAERIADARVQKRILALVDEIAELRMKSDLAAYRSHNERFHAALVELSGNKELSKLIRRLQIAIYYIQFRRQLDTGVIAQSLDDHEAICAAIRRGEPDNAERAMRHHVRQSSISIAMLPDSEFG
jgi:DNA-binding GntR family transcriptional regulator